MINDDPMTLRLFSRIRGLCLTVLFLMLAPAAQAENVVSFAPHQIAPLSADDRISNIVTVEGRAVALGEEYFWAFNELERRWDRQRARTEGQIFGIAGDGVQAFLLLNTEPGGAMTRVERFTPFSDEVLDSGQDIAAQKPTPPLPIALTAGQGAILAGKLYIAGLSLDGRSHLLALDLLADQPMWRSYQSWPEMADAGSSRAVTSVVAQNSALLVTTKDRLMQWTLDHGWQERSRAPGLIVEGTGRAMGQAHVLYIVKDMVDIEKNMVSGAKPNLMSFHTVTGSWAKYGDLDAAAAQFGTGWKNGVLWGQPGAAGGGADFSFVEMETGKHLLHAVDWFVIAAYLFSMLGVGLYFYTRHAQDSKSSFFLGGRSIPFWAAGISLYASNASSISYIAVPAKAFATNWQYLMSNLIVVLGLMFVAVWIVPLLRRLDLMSIFQYLETRFHPSIRVLSSALFIVFQLGGRMTIILFLPSLAISTVTGIDVVYSILIMGGITIIYTVLGGMKAVIWTDVMQLFVMFGGTIFAIIFVMLMLDGGVSTFFETAMAEDKMKLVDWSFDLTEATVWGFVFLVIFDTVLTFPKDQVLMQRILSTESAKAAGRSVWTFAAIVIPGSVMFYLIGTALYVFYQSFPERMDPSLSIDATFPLFIAAELPIGVTGLIIAGIFAASMSTLSSILNSVATLATVDFYEKIVENTDQKTSVRFAEIVTVIAGLIGIGLAVLLSRFEIKSLLDLALELWGLLGGGFAGAYTLGMFTRRANWQGVAIGVAVSIAITLAAWLVGLVHPYFYLPLSIMICIVVGYGASLFFPPPPALKGLTIYDDEPNPKSA